MSPRGPASRQIARIATEWQVNVIGKCRYGRSRGAYKYFASENPISASAVRNRLRGAAERRRRRGAGRQPRRCQTHRQIPPTTYTRVPHIYSIDKIISWLRLSPHQYIRIETTLHTDFYLNANGDTHPSRRGREGEGDKQAYLWRHRITNVTGPFDYTIAIDSGHNFSERTLSPSRMVASRSSGAERGGSKSQ